MKTYELTSRLETLKGDSMIQTLQEAHTARTYSDSMWNFDCSTICAFNHVVVVRHSFGRVQRASDALRDKIRAIVLNHVEVADSSHKASTMGRYSYAKPQVAWGKNHAVISQRYTFSVKGK